MGDKNNIRENIKYNPISNSYPFDADEWISEFLDRKNLKKPIEETDKEKKIKDTKRKRIRCRTIYFRNNRNRP